MFLLENKSFRVKDTGRGQAESRNIGDVRIMILQYCNSPKRDIR